MVRPAEPAEPRWVISVRCDDKEVFNAEVPVAWAATVMERTSRATSSGSVLDQVANIIKEINELTEEGKDHVDK